MYEQKNHYILFQASISRTNIVLTINEIEKHQSSNVTLMIHTAGGKSIEAFHFYNYVQSKKINLTTYNLSFIGSAGVDLFLCGEKRICSPFSSFMFHESSWAINQSLTIREMLEYIETDKTALSIKREFCKQRGGDLCAQSIEEWSKKDTTVSPQMALDTGLCTEINQITLPNETILSTIQSRDFGES